MTEPKYKIDQKVFFDGKEYKILGIKRHRTEHPKFEYYLLGIDIKEYPDSWIIEDHLYEGVSTKSKMLVKIMDSLAIYMMREEEIKKEDPELYKAIKLEIAQTERKWKEVNCD